jgi:enediyne biosynthesis protein E4
MRSFCSTIVLLCLVWFAICAPALEWQSGSGYRFAPIQPPPSAKAGFTRLTPEQTGISFTNVLADQRHLTNQILLNGSGVAAGDIDGDGWVDLYFCSLDKPNVLYRNLGGWKFEEITAQAGVACEGIDSTGAALVDLDGDGDLDLIVNSVGGGTHIFLNDGTGRFTRMTPPAGLNPGRGGTSLALGDLDGDGFLDLYIANYRTTALMDMPNTVFRLRKAGGRQVVDTVNGRQVANDPELANRYRVNARGGIEELGEPDALYRNVGGTNFVPVSFTDGTFLDVDGKPLGAPPFDWALSVMIRDIDGDGLPDIYVCNDFDSEEAIWMNLGNGRFQAPPRLALRRTSLFSMGVDFADINRDGFDDFFVIDMLSRSHTQRMNTLGDRKPHIPGVGELDNRPQYMLNTLFLNQRDGTYGEIAQLAGVAASEWSWGMVFLDVDLDGWEDILITNGTERDGRNLDVSEHLRELRHVQKRSDAEMFQARRLFPRQNSPNIAFRNRGDLTFEDAGGAWGFQFAGVSHGIALADLDNDGDLDVIVNNLNDEPGIYRNDTAAPRVAVRLKGRSPNTAGIGSRIVVSGGPVMQSQETIAGGRYLSSDQPMRAFAAGAITNRLRIEVQWRSGATSVVASARANHLYEIEEPDSKKPGAARERRRQTPPITQPFFEDVSALLAHTHHEDLFDDYARQPLLPRKLSQSGPGVSWFDIDGDGWDDLIVGSGRGGRLAVFRNDLKGGFERLSGAPLHHPITRDQTTVLGWRNLSGETVLLAGSSNYQDGLRMGSCVRQFNLGRKIVEDTFPGTEASVGPLALADVNGNGHLDLFVGGRVLPGKYPAPASSLLFRNSGARFELDEEHTKVLAHAGMVSGAVFSDISGNGSPDLVLACEWGGIQIFRNEAGRLTLWDAPVTLVSDGSLRSPGSTTPTVTQLTGWWNGIATGDFDGDGRMDIVASGWGRNTRYEMTRHKSLKLFHGDIDGDGTLELVEAGYDEGLGKVVPLRGFHVLAQAFPFLRERFASHHQFGLACVREIMGDLFATMQQAEAALLESIVLLNRGSAFEARALPVEAQMAPAFGICVADFDGDGNEDIFLSQNFFAVQPETPRYDAGRGLLLLGDGRGGFSAMPGVESGIRIYGEQRGCAAADYDADGRVDLAVAQNGGETKLYRNARAQPGLRVRLEGSKGNPDAIGATIRLRYADRLGPAREIQAGSGYGSQQSAVQVFSMKGDPYSVVVRWPGGEVTETKIGEERREIRIRASGRP